MKLEFRDLLPTEIDLRVGNIVKTDKFDGFTLLLYKDARVDMQLLDEVVGVGNWQREHIILGNDIYCKVSVWNDELKQWISRMDAGSSGTIEEEKSKASDSFKRACVNFGLGRCLYTAPSVLIPTSDENTPKKKYIVKDIAYKNHEITKLVIINEKTKKVVYSYGSNEKVAESGENEPKNPKSTLGSGKGTIRETEKALINAMLESKTIDECNAFYNWLDKHFGTMSVEMLSDEQGIIVCKKYKLI